MHLENNKNIIKKSSFVYFLKMNFLVRHTLCRQTSMFVCRRQLTSERVRRAFRSTPTRQTNNPNQSPPFGFINEKNVIKGVIIANGIVFVLWKFSYANLQTNHDGTLLNFMSKNFSTRRTRKVFI